MDIFAPSYTRSIFTKMIAGVIARVCRFQPKPSFCDRSEEFVLLSGGFFLFFPYCLMPYLFGSNVVALEMPNLNNW